MKVRYASLVLFLTLTFLTSRVVAHVDGNEELTPPPEGVIAHDIIDPPVNPHVPGVCAANDTCDDCFDDCQDDFAFCTRDCHPEGSETIYRECEHRCGITEWDCLMDASSNCQE